MHTNVNEVQQYGAPCHVGGRLSGVVGVEAARQYEIPHQIECLQRTLKGCYQGLDTLESRLEGSVMRGATEKSAESKSEPGTPIASTHIGGQLQGLTHDIAVLNDRIQSMNRRLEV